MWGITHRLAASLAASNHDVVNQLDILIDGQPALTVAGKTVVDPVSGADVSLVGGQVDVDRAVVRRRATVTIADASDILRPAQVGDLLLPLRSEIRPWRGLLYADRTVENPPADRELVPVGTLVVTKVTANWPTLTVTGYDRMWLLNRYRFTAPYTIAKGAQVTDALQQLLVAKMPANRLATSIPDLPYTTGLTVWDEQEAPADKANDLAESAGLALYADPMGTIVARREPTTDDDTQWSYVEGAGSMLMPWPSEELSGEDAENAVVVTGEPQDGSTPVYGYAENVTPGSALYAAAVGVVPRFFSTPLVTTAGQANLAAATILAKLGLSDTVLLSGLVNPALESGDVIYVQASHPAGLALKLIVDSFGVPLRGAGPQDLVTRARVVQ